MSACEGAGLEVGLAVSWTHLTTYISCRCFSWCVCGPLASLLFPSTCLPATLSLQSSTIPARFAASYLPSALYIHRWAIKDGMGAREADDIIYLLKTEKSRCVLQNLTFWVKKKGLWRPVVEIKMEMVKRWYEEGGRKTAGQNVLWEAARGDDC